jgi:hypothetical protein
MCTKPKKSRRDGQYPNPGIHSGAKSTQKLVRGGKKFTKVDEVTDE